MSVLYEPSDGIATITINRPQAHNALDPATSQELTQCWLRFRDDPSARVAILTGAGEHAFCAGADLARMPEFLRLSAIERRTQRECDYGLGGITRNLPLWKPTIAAINGHCYGGGLELALACDIRIAADTAQLGLLECKWGIIPGQGGTQRLPRAVPPNIALEMILTAERISAQRAYEVGLVNHVVPLVQLLDKARGIANKIAQNAPLAVRAAKEAVYRGLDLALEEGMRVEQWLADPLRDTQDVREGMASFREKRAPRYTGA